MNTRPLKKRLDDIARAERKLFSIQEERKRQADLLAKKKTRKAHTEK